MEVRYNKFVLATGSPFLKGHVTLINAYIFFDINQCILFLVFFNVMSFFKLISLKYFKKVKTYKLDVEFRKYGKIILIIISSKRGSQRYGSSFFKFKIILFILLYFFGKQANQRLAV